jgi:hypothetical protein
MKKDKAFDAVQTMRAIRDRMSEEMKGMSPREQIEYIEKKSGLRRKDQAGATPDGNHQAR